MNDILKTYRVDKNSPVPMYYQIKQEIIRSIKNKAYQSGDQLPTELEYCKALGISRPTIRQALQELINEGYITRHKAKGTFVSRPKVEGLLFKSLESYNDEMRALGMEPSTNVLHKEIIKADEEIAKALQLQIGDPVFYLVRLRFADDEPMAYSITYLPYKRFKRIDEIEIKKDTSLYKVLEAEYNCPTAFVDRVIETKNATSDLSALLKIDENQAVFFITTTSYDSEEVPFEYSVTRYRGDRCRFSLRLVQQ